MKKPWFVALLGLSISLALVLTALAGWLHGSEGRSVAPADLSPPADRSLGVNADLSRLDPAARAAALDQMEAAGLRWVRQRFPWDAIEPQPGAYEWDVWDEVVRDVTQHNLGIVAVLDGSPSWARAGEDAANPLAPPVEGHGFGEFALALAERYGAWLDVYQIWDEPNIAPHWGQRWVDPAAYSRLLREGAIQVRATDPGATVVAAALAPNVEPGGANMSDVQFLDAMYRNGAAPWFDVVAVQPYDFGEALADPADAGRLNWARAGLLRQVMEDNGDGTTPVWATSFARTDEPGGSRGESILAATEQARRSWPWLGPMLWAAWSPGDQRGQYALAGPGGGITPALETLVKSAARARETAWPGTYGADHPSADYHGRWRVTPQGADIGQSGDRMTIRFWGTRLDLLLRRGDYRAFLYVTVDGQPPDALPQDESGRAYVVLYDPLHGTEAVTLARDLPPGEHQVEIVADGGWGQWAVAGWSVADEAQSAVPWAPLALMVTSCLVLGLTVWRSWQHRRGLSEDASSLLRSGRALDDRLVLAVAAAAALLLYVAAGTLPSLVALAALGVVLLVRPEMGLPLIALALPFYQPGKPILGKVFSMVEILTLLTAVAWCANRLVSGPGIRARRRWSLSHLTALDWGVLALAVLGVASLLWSENVRVAARELRTVVLEAALFYGLLRAMLTERRDVWRLADAWLVGGVAVALVGLVQGAFGQNLITAEGVWRVRGFYGSPNNLALYLGRILPLAVAVGAWAERGWRRLLYALAALVMSAALVLTYSRGAWLLGVPASLLFLVVLRGGRVRLYAAAALAVVAGTGLLVLGPGRLASLFDTEQGTTFFRLQLWRSSWAMIRDHPVLGVGLDNFLYHYRTRYVLPTAWQELNLSHPHNLVLDFWLRLGLPGLILLGWLLWTFFRRSWRVWRCLPQGDERLLVLGIMAGMVGAIAHGVVDNAFFLVDLAFVFMLMAALVQANLSESVRPKTEEVPCAS